jgi:hypothetical protein
MTAVATSQGADQLGNAAALTDGYSAAFLGAAGIAVVGALLAAVLLRVPKAQDEASRESRRGARARRGLVGEARPAAGRSCPAADRLKPVRDVA